MQEKKMDPPPENSWEDSGLSHERKGGLEGEKGRYNRGWLLIYGTLKERESQIEREKAKKVCGKNGPL